MFSFIHKTNCVFIFHFLKMQINALLLNIMSIISFKLTWNVLTFSSHIKKNYEFVNRSGNVIFFFFSGYFYTLIIILCQWM